MVHTPSSTPILSFGITAGGRTNLVPGGKHIRPQLEFQEWIVAELADPSLRTGTGFKLNVLGLSSLSLNIGPVTTSPHAAVGISVDYEEFRTVNISAGTNVLPLNLPKSNSIIPKTHVVRIATEGWQNNRIELDSITLNKVAKSGLIPRSFF